VYYFGKIKRYYVDRRTLNKQYFDALFFNALAKGYAVKAGRTSQKIASKSKVKIRKGKKKKIIAKRVKGNGKLVYRSTNQKIVTVTRAGIIKAKKRGKAKIVINALPTTRCKAGKKTVTVVVK
ncbi:MAG: Ig-like domain-containing protein, partial [Firmicutes bacterium]|nr:Ig-like domain-containing protein [Bacillota bacterium]